MNVHTCPEVYAVELLRPWSVFLVRRVENRSVPIQPFRGLCGGVSNVFSAPTRWSSSTGSSVVLANTWMLQPASELCKKYFVWVFPLFVCLCACFCFPPHVVVFPNSSVDCVQVIWAVEKYAWSANSVMCRVVQWCWSVERGVCFRTSVFVVWQQRRIHDSSDFVWVCLSVSVSVCLSVSLFFFLSFSPPPPTPLFSVSSIFLSFPFSLSFFLCSFFLPASHPLLPYLTLLCFLLFSLSLSTTLPPSLSCPPSPSLSLYLPTPPPSLFPLPIFPSSP